VTHQIGWVTTHNPKPVVESGDVYEFQVQVLTRGGFVFKIGSKLRVMDRTNSTPHGEIGPYGYNWICDADNGTTVWATLEQCIERDLLRKI